MSWWWVDQGRRRHIAPIAMMTKGLLVPSFNQLVKPHRCVVTLCTEKLKSPGTKEEQTNQSSLTRKKAPFTALFIFHEWAWTQNIGSVLARQVAQHLFTSKQGAPLTRFSHGAKLRLEQLRTHLSLLIFVLPQAHCCRCCALQLLPRMPVSGLTANSPGQLMNDSTDKTIENPMKEIHVTQHKISSETVTKTGSSGFDLHYCSRQRLTRITSTFQHGL